MGALLRPRRWASFDASDRLEPLLRCSSSLEAADPLVLSLFDHRRHDCDRCSDSLPEFHETADVSFDSEP